MPRVIAALVAALAVATTGYWLAQVRPSDDAATSVSADGTVQHPGDEPLLSTTTTVVERDGERTLFVQVGFGGCTRFDRFEVTESAQAVQLLAVMETTSLPSADEQDQDDPLIACTSELRIPIEEVSLTQPLGERRVLGECDGGRPTCDTFGPPPPEERYRPEP